MLREERISSRDDHKQHALLSFDCYNNSSHHTRHFHVQKIVANHLNKLSDCTFSTTVATTMQFTFKMNHRLLQQALSCFRRKGFLVMMTINNICQPALLSFNCSHIYHNSCQITSTVEEIVASHLIQPSDCTFSTTFSGQSYTVAMQSIKAEMTRKPSTCYFVTQIQELLLLKIQEWKEKESLPDYHS